MVNFGLLAAEIVSLVWGTPSNFNGFRVLAALLHGTLVVGVSQTLRRWTEGATYFGRAAITLGIGPHSSFLFSASSRGPKKTGATSAGQRPSMTKFTKSVKAMRNSAPDSWHNIISRTCWGRKPSRPPAEPAGNERTAFWTSDSSMDWISTAPAGVSLGQSGHWRPEGVSHV